MPPQRRPTKPYKEGQIDLALQAYKKLQISLIRQAALQYDVPKSILIDRASGRSIRANTRANNHKLTTTKEEVLLT
jgi:hypothetical protein